MAVRVTLCAKVFIPNSGYWKTRDICGNKFSHSRYLCVTLTTLPFRCLLTHTPLHGWLAAQWLDLIWTDQNHHSQASVRVWLPGHSSHSALRCCHFFIISDSSNLVLAHKCFFTAAEIFTMQGTYPIQAVCLTESLGSFLHWGMYISDGTKGKPSNYANDWNSRGRNNELSPEYWRDLVSLRCSNTVLHLLEIRFNIDPDQNGSWAQNLADNHAGGVIGLMAIDELQVADVGGYTRHHKCKCSTSTVSKNLHT